jgi:hypothetical protein
MNSNSNNGPLIKAAGLWQKTSVKGGQYLTGRMGGLRVLIMENRDRKSDDDLSHHLLVGEAPARQGDEQRRQGQPQRSGFQGQRAPDHQAPLNADLDDAPEWAR